MSAQQKSSIDVIGSVLDSMIRLKQLTDYIKEHCYIEEGIAQAGSSEEQGGKSKGGTKEALGEALRSRARQMPELMASSGLVPTLTFYMAKASEDLYSCFYEYLVNPSQRPEDFCSSCEEKVKSKVEEEIRRRGPAQGRQEDVNKAVKKAIEDWLNGLAEELGKEGGGYSTLLALSAHFMVRAYSALANKDESEYKSKASRYLGLAELLNEIHKSGSGVSGEVALNRLMIDYLLEAKKLAEAFWGESSK